MKIITTTLNGKHIAYTDETEFYIQVGRYSKGAYKTRYKAVGSLAQAVMYFNGINIGNGYKKRLVAPCFNKPVLAKQKS